MGHRSLSGHQRRWASRCSCTGPCNECGTLAARAARRTRPPQLQAIVTFGQSLSDAHPATSSSDLRPRRSTRVAAEGHPDPPCTGVFRTPLGHWGVAGRQGSTATAASPAVDGRAVPALCPTRRGREPGTMDADQPATMARQRRLLRRRFHRLGETERPVLKPYGSSSWVRIPRPPQRCRGHVRLLPAEGLRAVRLVCPRGRVGGGGGESARGGR